MDGLGFPAQTPGEENGEAVLLHLQSALKEDILPRVLSTGSEHIMESNCHCDTAVKNKHPWGSAAGRAGHLPLCAVEMVVRGRLDEVIATDLVQRLGCKAV